MVRSTRNFGLAVAMLLVAPLSAQALSVSIVGATGSGASNTVLQPGETITFDLRVENGDYEELFGLGMGVRGYDLNVNGVVDDGLTLAGGQVTAGIFNTFRAPGSPNQAFGGIENSLTAPQELGFFNPVTFVREEKRVMLFNGVGLTAATGDGSDDVGIGGDYIGSSSDVHFQVVFTATPVSQELRDFTLDFGTMPDLGAVAVGNGGSFLSFGNTQYSLTVIPEPGTALLMGLGLAGLATQRRR
jgi:hypothetical protein